MGFGRALRLGVAAAFAGLLSIALPGCGGGARGPEVSSPAADSLRAMAEVPPEAVEWVRKTAIPVRTEVAGSGFDDLRRLRKVVGDARIVALGEPTHGTREAFQMKHRLLEYLVSEMGFTIFSIEASMPESYRIDDYVLGGEGDPADLIGGMHFWTWNTEEVLGMVEWMRRYNATAKRPVHFTGFDMQYLPAAASNVRQHLARVDPGSVAELDSLYSRVEAVSKLARPTFGVATAKFPVDLARGKRVRYSGWIRTQDVQQFAGLWWRVDGPKKPLAFDNMQDRGPKGTTGWTRYEIELPVDSLATNINFGVLMPGSGTAWFDDLQVELDGVVHDAGETIDLGFESKVLTGFYTQRGGGYSGSGDRDDPHGGAQCLKIESQGTTPVATREENRATADSGLVAARQVLEDLQAAREAHVALASPQDVDWAIQNARIVYQLAAMKVSSVVNASAELDAFRTAIGLEGESGSNIRDASMAANVAWILEQNPRAKIVLWAHNGHVARRAGWMGTFLEKRFPGQMVVVGFATASGSYTAMGSFGLGPHDLQPPPPRSIEAILRTSRLPRLVLDLRPARPGAAATGWACEPRPMRSIGAMAMTDQFGSSVARDGYDALVFLDATTPAVQLPTRPH